MATNTQQRGQNVPFVAPAGGVSSGDPVLIGTSLLIASEDVAATKTGTGYSEGVFKDIAAITGTAFGNLDPLYWNDTDGNLTDGPDVGTGTGHPFVGLAFGAKATASATCSIKLVPSA